MPDGIPPGSPVHRTIAAGIALGLLLMATTTACAQETTSLLKVRYGAPLSDTSVTSEVNSTSAKSVELVVDPKLEKDLDLTQFRTTSDPFEAPDGDNSRVREPDRQGLADVPASGSSQFSARGLAQILARIGHRPLVVVDLREESHGLLNGIPVSWASGGNDANEGLSLAQVRDEEKKLLVGLSRMSAAALVRPSKKGASNDFRWLESVRTVMSEKKLCRTAGVLYVRIPVTDHHRPLDEDVDRFVAVVRKARGAWFHFHCKAGKGRTTSFMAMLDMVINARAVSAEEIAYRQHRLGGSNLLEGVPDEGEQATSRDRASFLRLFHEYCRTGQDGLATSWSRWLAARAGR